MKLPGFTADSSLGASHEHYRTSSPKPEAVGAIPQWSTAQCYLDCMSYCEQMHPFEGAERCPTFCEGVCEPYPPDRELIPPPG